MNKFQRLQNLYSHHSLNHSHQRVSNLCHRIRAPAHILLQNGKKLFSTAAETNVLTEKASKDIIRVAAIYAGCGTVVSYLDMLYNGKVFILKWAVPTPERFLMFACCWGLAGCLSWLLFWSRSEVLIRAAASRFRYGVADGTRTSMMAMGAAGVSIGLFSLYFDYIDFRTRRSQYEAAMQPSVLSGYNTGRQGMEGIGSPDGVIPPTDAAFDEEDDEEQQDSSSKKESYDGGNVLISSQSLRNSKEKLSHKMGLSQNKNKNVSISKPEWNWDDVATNMYTPWKVFFQCNMPVWVLLGAVTGTVTATIMTRGVLLHGMGAAFGATAIWSNAQETQQETEQEREQEIQEQQDARKEKREVELIRIPFGKEVKNKEE